MIPIRTTCSYGQTEDLGDLQLSGLFMELGGRLKVSPNLEGLF